MDDTTVSVSLGFSASMSQSQKFVIDGQSHKSEQGIDMETGTCSKQGTDSVIKIDSATPNELENSGKETQTTSFIHTAEGMTYKLEKMTQSWSQGAVVETPQVTSIPCVRK